MNIRRTLKLAEKALADNSPALLTAVGAMGVLSTAYLAGRASYKAHELIVDEQEAIVRNTPDSEHARHITERECFLLIWKLYIPAATSALFTVTAIVAANRIALRRAAAMAAAYSLSEKALAEYKEKIREKFGENKEREVHDELMQEQVNRNPVGAQQVIITGGGTVLCYDTHTGRYFQSDMETMKQAQNDTNYMINNNYYASLNDFYEKLGVPRIKNGDDFGWNSDKLLELMFTTTMSEDGKTPCLAMDFQVEPIRGYARVH